jgi:hypothetical protein
MDALAMVRIDYLASLTPPPVRRRICRRRATGATAGREETMPLFLIERQFAQALQLDASGVAAIRAINADVGVDWLYSFLSADRKKT